jgi:hypothetical protein
MNIVPTRIQEQVNRVDRNYSLYIAIATAVITLWCVYQLFWAVYAAAVLSSYGWSPISMVFSFVIWGGIGVVAAIASVTFWLRYKQS